MTTTARILAVDDVQHNLDLMTYLLGAFGFDVVGASTGRQALDAAGKQTPDLVVLDIQLPDMDGYEVFATAGDVGAAAVRVIAVTAFAMLGDRDEALAAGFDGYLAKPIDPARLAETIESIPASGRSAGPTNEIGSG